MQLLAQGQLGRGCIQLGCTFEVQANNELRNLTEEDEAELHEQGFNRVTDTCIPEKEAIRHIEDKILNQWKSEQAFPHDTFS